MEIDCIFNTCYITHFTVHKMLFNDIYFKNVSFYVQILIFFIHHALKYEYLPPQDKC